MTAKSVNYFSGMGKDALFSIGSSVFFKLFSIQKPGE
jgi:hypothetical protein